MAVLTTVRKSGAGARSLAVSLLFETEDLLPVILHVDTEETAIAGGIEALVKAADARLPVRGPVPARPSVVLHV